MSEKIEIIECPRDAMQGIKEFISTDLKAEYINSLLKVGFDTIDFGSFVSPKAIPQLKDTAEVLAKLDLNNTNSKLLAIVANMRGVEQACSFDEIQYLGYPFSISETFLARNINSSIEKSWEALSEIQNTAAKHNKELVVYISMAFGNPYGDDWSPDLVAEWTQKLYSELGIKIIALSDTVGSSTTEQINDIFTTALASANNDLNIGAHLHTTPADAELKVKALLDAGCKRIDVALGGFGGCPMAKEDLTGNMPTEALVKVLNERNLLTLDKLRLNEAQLIMNKVFN